MLLLQTAGGKLPASLNYFVSFSWGSFVFLEKLRLIEYVRMHPQVCVQSQEEDQQNPLNSWFIFCKVSLSFLQNFMTYYTLSQRIIWPPEVSQLFHLFSRQKLCWQLLRYISLLLSTPSSICNYKVATLLVTRLSLRCGQACMMLQGFPNSICSVILNGCYYTKVVIVSGSSCGGLCTLKG